MARYGFLLLSLVSLARVVVAQPAQVPFDDCTSSATRSASNYDPNARINISAVYAQIAYPNGQKTLRLRAIADVGEDVEGSETDADNKFVLSTLFQKTEILTFILNANRSWFCNTARPPSPLPPLNSSTNTYCPIPAGQLAWSVDAPLQHDYNLTSIITRVRVVDPSEPGRELACVDVDTTPVKPNQQKTHNVGYPQIIFWLSVGLAIGYWVVIGAARISVAWSRGVASGPGWSSIQWAGTVFASAVSAERLSTHSALLRFATPSYRDVLFHTQWCACLAMIAVQWPTFAYPILSNTAWASLIYNITITIDSDKSNLHWDPLNTPYNPPSNFADQFADSSSPLFLDNSIPNNLYVLPAGAKDGMESFAYAVGVRPQDLFSLCLKIWLIVVGVAIVVSGGIWFIDWCVSSCMMGGRRDSVARARRGSMNELNGYDTPAPGSSKEASDTAPLGAGNDEEGNAGQFQRMGGARGLKVRRRWWHHRLGQSSFHGSVLQGNLVRLLVLFHLPITIFTTYEFTRGSPGTGSGDKASSSSLALAAIAFALISVLIPALLIARLAVTPTKKLYDATRTLLALGPLYSHYAHGAQMFSAVILAHSLAVGITVGAGQGSGTAQTIVLLVIEVASALATSIWLPWGERASMGIMSFLFCVARIVTVVLLIILSPLVSVGDSAGGWIAYAIILIQGLVYLAFTLMLFVKIIEGFVRLFGRVPFDKATHSMDSGLLGALSQAGCCGARRRPAKGRRRHNRSGTSGTVGLDSSGKHTPNSTMGINNGRPSVQGYYQQGQNPSYRSSPASQIGPQLSFLRPEQAFQPYREEHDDESGFIMGAWTGSEARYHPVANPNDPGPSGSNVVAEPVKASGFSRVGGGRATHDDPFAALPPAAMSAAAQARSGHTRQASSVGSPTAALPPGAMPPRTHTRVQSHAAVIENIGGGALVPPRGLITDDDSSATGSSMTGAGKRGGGGGGGFWQRRAASSPNQRQDSYDEEDGDVGKGGPSRSWFGRLMHRSEGDSSPVPSTPPPEAGPSSFVVVRGKKPSGASTVTPRQEPVASGEDEAPKSSFVVVRPKRSSLPSGSALSPPSRDSDKRAST